MRQPKFLYKVVSADNRSTGAFGKYNLEYRDNRDVESIPGTIGIFCFTNKKIARKFKHSEARRFGKIKKCIPISEVRNTDLCSRCEYITDEYLDDFYNRQRNRICSFFEGTVLCDKLHVIGDIR